MCAPLCCSLSSLVFGVQPLILLLSHKEPNVRLSAGHAIAAGCVKFPDTTQATVTKMIELFKAVSSDAVVFSGVLSAILPCCAFQSPDEVIEAKFGQIGRAHV